MMVWFDLGLGGLCSCIIADSFWFEFLLVCLVVSWLLVSCVLCYLASLTCLCWLCLYT